MKKGEGKDTPDSLISSIVNYRKSHYDTSPLSDESLALNKLEDDAIKLSAEELREILLENHAGDLIRNFVRRVLRS